MHSIELFALVARGNHSFSRACLLIRGLWLSIFFFVYVEGRVEVEGQFFSGDILVD